MRFKTFLSGKSTDKVYVTSDGTRIPRDKIARIESKLGRAEVLLKNNKKIKITAPEDDKFLEWYQNE